MSKDYIRVHTFPVNITKEKDRTDFKFKAINLKKDAHHPMNFHSIKLVEIIQQLVTKLLDLSLNLPIYLLVLRMSFLETQDQA